MEQWFLLPCTPSHDVHPVLGHVGGSGGVSAFSLLAAHEHSACTKHMCWVQTEQLLCLDHCMRVHDYRAKAVQLVGLWLSTFPTRSLHAVWGRTALLLSRLLVTAPPPTHDQLQAPTFVRVASTGSMLLPSAAAALSSLAARLSSAAKLYCTSGHAFAVSRSRFALQIPFFSRQ